jgi:hypothetical protein
VGESVIISWGGPRETKYLSFVYGSEWDKEDFKLIGFRKVPLGWSMNTWRLSISYDDYGKVSK